jgi:aspartate aminotransferase
MVANVRLTIHSMGRLACVKQMTDRIRSMRVALHAKLIELQTPGSWEHLLTQIGMFSYLDINGRLVYT